MKESLKPVVGSHVSKSAKVFRNNGNGDRPSPSWVRIKEAWIIAAGSGIVGTLGIAFLAWISGVSKDINELSTDIAAAKQDVAYYQRTFDDLTRKLDANTAAMHEVNKGIGQHVMQPCHAVACEKLDRVAKDVQAQMQALNRKLDEDPD